MSAHIAHWQGLMGRAGMGSTVEWRSGISGNAIHCWVTCLHLHIQAGCCCWCHRITAVISHPLKHCPQRPSLRGLSCKFKGVGIDYFCSFDKYLWITHYCRCWRDSSEQHRRNHPYLHGASSREWDDSNKYNKWRNHIACSNGTQKERHLGHGKWGRKVGAVIGGAVRG